MELGWCCVQPWIHRFDRLRISIENTNVCVVGCQIWVEWQPGISFIYNSGAILESVWDQLGAGAGSWFWDESGQLHATVSQRWVHSGFTLWKLFLDQQNAKEKRQSRRLTKPSEAAVHTILVIECLYDVGSKEVASSSWRQSPACSHGCGEKVK